MWRTADSDIHTNDSATIPGGDRGIALPRDAMTLPPAGVAMPSHPPPHHHPQARP
jgi:hypothetical protein